MTVVRPNYLTKKLTDVDAERLETQHKCTVLHIMVTSLRSKWAAGKARERRAYLN
jgi:hypothetical protein